MPSYLPVRSLGRVKILSATERLETRARERFPERGITQVAREAAA
jgi:hypothetical protein